MIKTLNLNGTVSVIIDAAHAHIRNDSEDTRVCVSTHPDPTEGEDGVLTIPPGQAAALYNCTGTIYLDGYGPAVVISSNYAVSPFKTAPALSGSSGGGTITPAVPVLHAGSLGYYVQAQHYTTIIEGVYDSLERHLVFIPQDLAAFSEYLMPSDDPLDAAVAYSGILRLSGDYPYPTSMEVRTTGGETITTPENCEFWLWNNGESDLETYLYPDAVAGETPFPPVQLDKITAQGAYLWIYGTLSRNGGSAANPVIMLTENTALPIMLATDE